MKKKIAVLLGGINLDSQKRLIYGILETAMADGTDVYIFTCDAWSYGEHYRHEKGEYNIYKLPDFTQFDGILINTVTIHDLETVDTVIERIIESGTPCVSLNNMWDGAINITIENRKGTRELAEHLIQVHNVGSIYYVAGPTDNQDSQERLEVFKDVMDENHLSWDDDCIYHGDYTYRAGVEAVEYFMQLDRSLPEAIMCGSDSMAIGAIQKLTSEGYHVPADIIVTGYDDTDIAALNNPRVTSLRKGMYDAAVLAYEKLKQAWNNEPVEDGVINGTAIFSGSCGCKRRNNFAYEKLQDLYVRKQIEMDFTNTTLKASAAEFTGIERFNDLMVSLRKYIRQINPEYFYLCTNGDVEGYLSELDRVEAGHQWERDITAYQDEIWVPFAYEKGRISQYKSFDKELLLPPDRDKAVGASFYIVLPLHHEDYCFGYCVIGNYKLMIERQLVQHFIMNLCNAMESIRRQEEMKIIMKKMNQMWRYDNLTGIYNRAGFYDVVVETLERAEFKGQSVSLFFIDTDGLKKVNDTYGHDEGDIFIKAMANVLSNNCRSDDLVCRYGGDEFIVFTTGLTEVTTQSFKNRIQTALTKYNSTNSHEWILDASIGCCFERDAANVDLNRLIETADQDMYKVKRKKKTFRGNENDRIDREERAKIFNLDNNITAL